MDRFASTFFFYMNADASDPDADTNKAAAIQTLVDLMRRGLGMVDPGLAQASPGNCLVAAGEAAGRVQLPPDFIASEDVFKSALQNLAGYVLTTFSIIDLCPLLHCTLGFFTTLSR